MQVGPLSKESKTSFRGRQQLKRDLEHITQEMYLRNHELAETNKTLSLLRAIDTLVLESHDSLDEVCKAIAQAITKESECACIAILTRAGQTGNTLRISGFSVKGRPKLSYLPGVHRGPIRIDFKSRWFEDGRQKSLIPVSALPLAELSRVFSASESEVEQLLTYLPVKALYIMKLTARHKIVGAVIAGFTNEPAEVSQGETDLLDHLKGGIGIAIDNKLLSEENSLVLLQIKESNAKLRALDEAKDEFISMASHQLRTPLTAVKGYLSMALEGDGGKLKPEQTQLLNEAYTSAQRMVFLISDFLNVSRIRTGKFVLEAKPTNLKELIGQEIDQLKATAASRRLTLRYEEPSVFPTISLDENKIRQVIMNFIDNAIYYTPAGGTIRVELYAKDREVIFKVIDTGIGVPPSERHHLFTKFFRATNARRARPDGTGIGLFMAKKIVVLHGGSIIFESSLGRGSTFGFSLPLTSDTQKS